MPVPQQQKVHPLLLNYFVTTLSQKIFYDFRVSGITLRVNLEPVRTFTLIGESEEAILEGLYRVLRNILIVSSKLNPTHEGTICNVIEELMDNMISLTGGDEKPHEGN